MDSLLAELGNHLLYVIIGSVFIVGLVLKAVTVIFVSGARERTRREIAAYIAEGSMTPDQGERLLKANVNSVKTEF